MFARLPLAQRAIKAVTDALYEFMVYVAVVHRRTFRGRFNIAASDLAKIYRFVTIRDKDLRQQMAQRHPCTVVQATTRIERDIETGTGQQMRGIGGHIRRAFHRVLQLVQRRRETAEVMDGAGPRIHGHAHAARLPVR